MSHIPMPARFVSRRLLYTFGLLTLGSLLLAGCGGGDKNVTGLPATASDTSNGPVTSTPRSFNNLEFVASTPHAAYKVGESVPLTFTIKNIGTQPIKLTSGPCPDYLNVIRGGQIIASQPVGCGAGAGPTTVLQPGQMLSYPEMWDGRDTEGKEQSTGAFSVICWYSNVSIDGGPTIGEPQAQTQLNANPVTVTLNP